VAAHASWAATPDPTARTEPARQAFRDRFERQVDRDGTLSPAERARRAESARKAYYLGLALKSAVARRKSRELASEADAADAELAGSGIGA
jgi:hypothetical protein